MLRIQRSSNTGAVFTLTGRIEIEDVAELQRLLSLEDVGRGIALDLEDVTLINRDALKFLANWEADCIKLEHCPGYIRVWIDRDKQRRGGGKNSREPGTKVELLIPDHIAFTS